MLIDPGTTFPTHSLNGKARGQPSRSGGTMYAKLVRNSTEASDTMSNLHKARLPAKQKQLETERGVTTLTPLTPRSLRQLLRL